ncbi:hypothetical protein ACWEOZ_33560 [Actinoplanes sp. NPDC004185]
MLNLSEQTLAAIGRMTVAATDLEHLLAWIGADRAGGDAAAVFAVPGEPLTAARGSVQFAAGSVRQELIAGVEAAGTQLAIGQAALRRLWRDDDTAADAATFDDITGRLVSCREWLAGFAATAASLNP